MTATATVTGTLEADCGRCDEAGRVCPFDGREATREQIVAALGDVSGQHWVALDDDGDVVREGGWGWGGAHGLWVDLDVEDAVAVWRLGLLDPAPDDHHTLAEATADQIERVLDWLDAERWADVTWRCSTQQDYLLGACESHGQELAWIDRDGRLDVIDADGDVLRTDIRLSL